MNKKENINIVLGQRIRTLRKIMGVSQTEIASKVGFTYQQLQKYESGHNRIAVDTLEAISEALGVTATDLLSSAESGDVPSIMKFLLGQNDFSQEQYEAWDSILQFEPFKDRNIQKSLSNLLQAVQDAASEKTS